MPKYSKQKIQISESSCEEENDTSEHYLFDGSNVSTDFYGCAPDCINLEQPIKADSLIFDEFVPEHNLCMQPFTGDLQEPTSKFISITPMSPATPQLRTDKNTDILSSRAKHRNSKSKSVKTSFHLPSGSILTFSTNPKSETIKDLK